MAYEPLDLSAAHNAGLEVLGGVGPLGEQALRGLPFQLGTDPQKCLVACGEEGAEIAIGRQATWLVVAHRLLESGIGDNGPLGVEVAQYAFHYADDKVIRTPVRDRFEISMVPHAYGGAPFVAVPDTNDRVLPRDAGEWGSAGRVKTGKKTN